MFLEVLQFCDREGIQTPNPQSRNLMRYSVAPRGLFSNPCVSYLNSKPQFLHLFTVLK